MGVLYLKLADGTIVPVNSGGDGPGGSVSAAYLSMSGDAALPDIIVPDGTDVLM